MASRPVAEHRSGPAFRGERRAGAAARPALRLVRGKERTLRARRWRAALAFIGAAVFVTGGLVGIVAAHVALTQGQFALGRLQGQLAKEHTVQEQLRLQVAQLQSPQRIVQTAEQRLHMVSPSTVTYLTPVTAPASAPTPASPAPKRQAAVATPGPVAHPAPGTAVPPRAAATTAGGARR